MASERCGHDHLQNLLQARAGPPSATLSKLKLVKALPCHQGSARCAGYDGCWPTCEGRSESRHDQHVQLSERFVTTAAGPGQAGPAVQHSPAGQAGGPAVSVLIADDQRLVRAGFSVILAAEPDIVVVGEAADGLEAIE